MQNVNRDRWRGVQWGLVNRLEDLDLCLLSETHGDMQTKLEDLTNNPVKTGLVVNVKDTKALNTHKKYLFSLRSENIEDVDSFTYLTVWGLKMGVLHRMYCINSKSKWCFRTVWKNSRISTRAKLRIIRSNVKSVLLYGSETWKEMKTVTSRLQTFVNRCLRRILNIC